MKKSKPDHISLCLVDADIISYRAAFATNSPEKTEKDCEEVIDKLIAYILDQTVVFPVPDRFKLFLTGKGNFRHGIMPLYKHQRKEVEKPKFIDHARGYLVDNWGAVVVDGIECDDAIAMEVEKHQSPETTVVVSQDKDFRTLNCWMFNFVKDFWDYSSKEDALLFFYTQVIMGDRVDGYYGVPKLGPVKAEKILKDCKTEREMFEAALKAYEDYGMTLDDLMVNARMAHLLREEGVMWEIPV